MVLKFISIRYPLSTISGLSLLTLLVPAFAGSSAQAQVITTTCETTIIESGGVIIPGSEITTCTSTVTQVADGSQLADSMNNSCGTGNPCPTAPADTDEGLTEEQQCAMEQSADSERDRQANEIANAIRSVNNATSNPNNAEFGAFVLRLNNGQYVSSPIRSGQTGQISMNDMLSSAQSAYPGIDASNIVGIVHLHPRHAGPGFADVSDISQLSDVDYGATMPSHPNIAAGPNDWVNGRSFLLARGRTNVADVAHYILGPDGVLREYDYADGHPAEAAEQNQLINNAAKDAKGECP